MRSPLYLYPFIALLLVVLNYYFLKVAQTVIIVSDPYLLQFWSKTAIFRDVNSCVRDWRTDGQTDRLMDGQTHPLIEMRDRI